MNERLRNHIDKLFEQAPISKETSEVKEELLANFTEHYDDLLASGKSEEEAYNTVVNNIGDVDEMVKSLQDAATLETERKSDSNETNTGNQEHGWSIGGMIDDFISSISSAFDMDCPMIKDTSYSSVGINCINMSFISESIRIFLHDSEEIRLVEYMSKKPTEEEMAKVEIFNGECNIKNGRRLFFISKSKVDLYLPKNYHGDMNIKVTSSTIKSEEVLELRNVAIKGVSASIKISGIHSESTDINVASGSIKVGKLTGRHNLSTDSGSIHVNRVSGGGRYKTISGSVQANYDEIDDNIDVSVVSGSIRVGVPNFVSFRYDLSTISGSIHTNFNATQYSSSRHSVQGVVGDNPQNNIHIKTTSGNIWMQNV